MLTTTAGNHYTLSFDLFSGGATNSLFDAFFDSVSVYSLSNTVIGWTHFEFTDLVATGASTELKFGARNDPSFTRLDNISVLSTSQSVPEPESLALFAAGAFALVVARRRHVK